MDDNLIPGRHNPRHGAQPNSPLPSVNTPKPPTVRGWVLRKIPISPSGKSWMGQRVPLDTREVDRTFENEVRPS